MANLTEPIIYLECKKILQENGWHLVGGEPPDGSDNLPRIEIKDQMNLLKGSKGSKKVDLIAFKSGKFILLELKSTYSEKDVEKLNSITKTQEGIVSFYRALMEKNILNHKIFHENQGMMDADGVVKAIGIGIEHKIPEDFLGIIVDNSGYKIIVGPKCPISKSFFEKKG